MRNIHFVVLTCFVLKVLDSMKTYKSYYITKNSSPTHRAEESNIPLIPSIKTKQQFRNVLQLVQIGRETESNRLKEILKYGLLNATKNIFKRFFEIKLSWLRSITGVVWKWETFFMHSQ